jgi:hypothetical protein
VAVSRTGTYVVAPIILPQRYLEIAHRDLVSFVRFIVAIGAPNMLGRIRGLCR